ncbi:dolichol phosphate-mannose biosynthesis regulatory protein [Cladochytrium replicatum]|nr:dolichol phosphate-mannose biosynthesis regulatory protein [Cladochytrium replicatum]
MASLADRLVGGFFLFVSVLVFVYYSVWALLLPFVDVSSHIHSLFPPRVWAIRAPLLLLVIGVTVIVSFISLVMIRSAAQKKPKLH